MLHRISTDFMHKLFNDDTTCDSYYSGSFLNITLHNLMWFILTSWIEMYQSLLTILATNHNTIPPTNRNADKSITSFVWISNHHLNLQMTSVEDVITHHQQSFAGLISPRQKKINNNNKMTNKNSISSEIINCSTGYTIAFFFLRYHFPFL